MEKEIIIEKNVTQNCKNDNGRHEPIESIILFIYDELEGRETFFLNYYYYYYTNTLYFLHSLPGYFIWNTN